MCIKPGSRHIRSPYINGEIHNVRKQLSAAIENDNPTRGYLEIIFEQKPQGVRLARNMFRNYRRHSHSHVEDNFGFCNTARWSASEFAAGNNFQIASSTQMFF